MRVVWGARRSQRLARVARGIERVEAAYPTAGIAAAQKAVCPEGGDADHAAVVAAASGHGKVGEGPSPPLVEQVDNTPLRGTHINGECPVRLFLSLKPVINNLRVAKFLFQYASCSRG